MIKKIVNGLILFLVILSFCRLSAAALEIQQKRDVSLPLSEVSLKVHAISDSIFLNEVLELNISAEWIGGYGEVFFSPPDLSFENLSLDRISSNKKQVLDKDENLRSILTYTYHIIPLKNGKAVVKPFQIEVTDSKKNSSGKIDFSSIELEIKKNFSQQIKIVIVFLLLSGVAIIFCAIAHFFIKVSASIRKKPENLNESPQIPASNVEGLRVSELKDLSRRTNPAGFVNEVNKRLQDMLEACTHTQISFSKIDFPRIHELVDYIKELRQKEQFANYNVQDNDVSSIFDYVNAARDEFKLIEKEL